MQMLSGKGKKSRRVPILQEQIGAIILEKFQGRSIKMIKGLTELIFEKRLRKINVQPDT
jgi:hypothetical protein